MTTKPKSNSVVSVSHNANDDRLIFTVAGVGELELDMKAVADSVCKRALLHGFTQRIQDAAALSRDSATGKPASPEDKYAAMKALVDHYNSGTEEWSVRKSGDPRDNTGLVLRAIMRVKNIGEATAREQVARLASAKFGDDVKAAYRLLAKSEAVALAMLDIKREAIKTGGDDLLAELG